MVGTAPWQSGQGTGERREAPAEVVASRALVERLRIATEPVYRLRVRDGELEIGPVLGLLLGNRNHWYDHDYLAREAERVTEVYARTGGLFCAFSVRNVSIENECAYGLRYDPRTSRWRYGELPLPAVMHRRSFHTPGGAVERLRQISGLRLFNSRRFDKWELHEILSQDPIFRAHLPETTRVHQGTEIFDLLARHGRVVLKPWDLSRGRGILFVETAGHSYVVADCRMAGCTRISTLSGTALEALIVQELVGRRYLCQQVIDLARIEGAPFDIRVVMQKAPGDRWRCHGIECRLAAQGSPITNISFGGRALRLTRALELAFGGAVDPGHAEQALLDLAQRFCRLLDRTGECFAEFGMDLALDRAGRPWFIESNVLPTFHGFEALDRAMYRRLLAAPLEYASYLAGFQDEPTGDIEEGKES